MTRESKSRGQYTPRVLKVMRPQCLTMNIVRATVANINFLLSVQTNFLEPGRALPIQSAVLKTTNPKGIQRRGYTTLKKRQESGQDVL